jgi:hypothetical protein
MPDLIDRAQEAMEQLDEIRARKRPTDPSPQATGLCLWCGEPVPDGRRWCGPECRDDWEWHDEHCL